MQIMPKVAFSSAVALFYRHRLWMDYNRMIKKTMQIFCQKWIFFQLGKSENDAFFISWNGFHYHLHVVFIFSCALLELWSEGTAPFEFSQLLAYRSGDMELVAKHLDELENENLRNLIASMISQNPSDRKSAEVYLDEQRGK